MNQSCFINVNVMRQCVWIIRTVVTSVLHISQRGSLHCAEFGFLHLLGKDDSFKQPLPLLLLFY